ncbi:unnamed protein product [Protopolystoma xenopodis]|uniref:Anaphase-promoting complex subunit 4 WD40 domain-containing protein n=1 Tax=Protopolystoma xenopodis TaxID=117903 RepID=A0A3S5CP75_9PLAT|nr:unnamed protein product [Protopolystoma xenopodis]
MIIIVGTQLGYSQPIICLSWHPKGGYLLSLSQAVETNQLTSRTACRRLLLHRLAGMTSQSPFAEALAPDSGPGVDEQLGSSFTSRLRRAEHWRLAAFHPGGTKPHLYVTSDHLVHIFDLAERKELRRLRLDSASDKISAFAVHSSGAVFIKA